MSSRSHRLGAVTENLAAATHRKGTAPGLFVCFEGGDGAGKSTQVRLLTESLRQRGREVVVTRQPGGTPLGAQIRELVLHGAHVSARAEALLFQLIKPALAAGQVVITDRYVDSSITYQGAGRELGADEITALQHWAVDGLLPDLTVVLDVSPEVGRERRGDVHDRLESEADVFHAAVRRGYLGLASQDPERYLVLDASQTVERLHAAVVDGVDRVMAARR